jgi:hypothetical protein
VHASGRAIRYGPRVQDRPAGIGDADIAAALVSGWGIEARELDYRAAGAGSYHWAAVDRLRRSWWVTVDGLGFEDSFDRLERALDTALILRGSGLEFVVAATPAATGALLWRLSPAYGMAVFPLLAGNSGEFGPHRVQDRPAVLDMLIALHRATPAVIGTASRTDLRLPGRVRLQVALRELDRPWTSGPYAEPARKALAAGAATAEDWLDEFDRLVAEVRADRADWVVTHGEPHPANIMWTPDGLRLIDWDTVQIAPPERDLWMLADDESLARYDKPVSTAGLALYRLWWRLADVAAYVDDLRRPHGSGGDAEAALAELTGYLADATG